MYNRGVNIGPSGGIFTTKLLFRLLEKNKQDIDGGKARSRYGILAGVVGVLCNVFLFVLKFIMGGLTGSIAVTADAFNNLTDVGSSLVTLVGFKLSTKSADQNHPYGYGRVEYLCGLVVSSLIMLVGFEVGKTAVQRIFAPQPVSFSWVAVAALLASILVKLWLGAFNRTIGKKMGSAAVKATAIDSLSDVFATTVTLISVVCARFTTFPVDGIMGVLVAAVILYAGFTAARDTLSPLLGEKPDPELAMKIKDIILSFDGVLSIHDLEIHDYGPSKRLASVHAEVSHHSDILAAHDLVERAAEEVRARLGVETVIHLDPVEHNTAIGKKMKQTTKELVAKLDPAFSIHDFRMVYGDEHTTFIFGLSVPVDTALKDEEITAKIAEQFRLMDPAFFAVVHIDRNGC